MIFASFAAALGQMGDRRFLKVLGLGLGLTLGLLALLYAGMASLLGWLLPGSFTLPWIGTITWFDDLVSWGSLAVMLALSVFLMVPVASAFTGLFLDEVAEAVEDRHYPGLPPANRQTLGQTLSDTLGLFGLIVVVNAAALIAYFFVGPFAPLLFWAVNGYLLGREYFQQAAIRRLGRPDSAAMRSRHGARIWLAGTLMAAPLTIPLVNLLVPVLGAATFTHLYHRLRAAEMRRR